jgi:hypothetical protein
MENKSNSRDKAYYDSRDTAPSKAGLNSDTRNNNMDNDTDQVPSDDTIERANDTGIGDSGQNDEKLTKYTSNHSGDA